MLNKRMNKCQFFKVSKSVRKNCDYSITVLQGCWLLLITFKALEMSNKAV